MKKLIFILLILFITSISFAGTKVIDYGWEDYVGESGNSSPAPGWLFGTSYESYWNDQLNCMECVSTGDGDCAGAAYEGTRYLHVEKYDGGSDACLNDTCSSVNTHANFGGGNYAYPTGTSDTTSFPSAITTNTITIRFYMRTTGSWTTVQGAIDGGQGHKFVRVYGDDGEGDSSSVILKLTNDDNDPTPRIVLWTDGNAWKEVGVNWQDGNWHAWVFQVVRNNDVNGANNVTANLWIDDWDMAGAPNATDTGTASDYGSQYHHVAFSSNWSARYPTTFMGYDIDKFEVWDDEPGDVAPSLNSATIASNGTTLTLVFDENVNQDVYNDNDLDLDASVTGDNIPLEYVSGDGGDEWVYTITEEIQIDEVVNFDFNGDADSIKDDTDNDLAEIVDRPVTNNSTQGGDVTPPTVSSATVSANGTTFTLVYDENVTRGAGYDNSDLNIDATITGSNIALAYQNGDGGDTHEYLIDATIISTDTVDFDFYSVDAHSLEDDSGNDLATINNGSVTNNSTQETPDTDPPLPEPADWQTAPNTDGNAINMTAEIGSDIGGSTPIEYYFDYDQGNSQCGSDGGIGGVDSGWQENTYYERLEDYLEANQCYGYSVQMRDSIPNTGTASSFMAAYTVAERPTTPVLSNPTNTTLNLSNGAHGNPETNPTTLYAQQCTATSPEDLTWLNKWIDASGDPSAVEVWLSDANWDAIKLQGLNPSTDYDVKSKAKNEDGIETNLSLAGQGTTTGDYVPPLNGVTGFFCY